MEKKISELSLNQLQSIVGGIAYTTATASVYASASAPASMSGVKVPVWTSPVVR